MGDLQGEGSWSICIVVIYLSEEGATTAGDHDRVSGYSDKRSLSEHSLLVYMASRDNASSIVRQSSIVKHGRREGQTTDYIVNRSKMLRLEVVCEIGRRQLSCQKEL